MRFCLPLYYILLYIRVCCTSSHPLPNTAAAFPLPHVSIWARSARIEFPYYTSGTAAACLWRPINKYASQYIYMKAKPLVNLSLSLVAARLIYPLSWLLKFSTRATILNSTHTYVAYSDRIIRDYTHIPAPPLIELTLSTLRECARGREGDVWCAPVYPAYKNGGDKERQKSRAALRRIPLVLEKINCERWNNNLRNWNYKSRAGKLKSRAKVRVTASKSRSAIAKHIYYIYT